MFYIYNKATSAIISNPTKGKHYLKAEYKTMAAAKAALTRICKASGMLPTNPEYPLYQNGIAEAGHYHEKIEKFEYVKSMMNPDGPSIRQSVNTPAYMDPSRESYWSM